MTDKFFYPASVLGRLNGEHARALEDGLPFEIDENAPPFFWPAEISSNRLDSYYSRMHQSSLENFAADATAGVSFLDSHDSRKLGFGQSIRGVFEQVDSEKKRAVVDFYTIPGINFGGQHSYSSTDDFIRAVNGGLARDVSVGFYDGREICDICEMPVWGMTDCQHWPGDQYERPTGERVTATYTIFDARLAEVSAVFDGATPEAMILKAQRHLSAGDLTQSALQRLEVRYRAKFPSELHKKIYTIGTKKTGGNSVSLEMKLRTMLELSEEGDVLAAISELTQQTDRATGNSARLTAEVEKLTNELTEAKTRIAEMEPQATDGKAYRSDLINSALAEGVRANGSDFAQEKYRGILEAAGIDIIKQMKNDWQKLGDKRFTGGRATEDDAPQQEAKADIPDEAFEVGGY